MKKLGDLLEFKNGINASKEQYGKGVKFINVLDILNNDFITYKDIASSVDVNNEIVAKYQVNYGDILFQRSSETREEVGTANVYLDKERPATFGGFVIRGRKTGEYEPVFLNKLLKTEKARSSITSKSGGSTRYNVGQETLASVELWFPILREQEKIGKLLSLIDERIQAQSKIIQRLETLMQVLRRSLFRQKLRFKNYDGQQFPDWVIKKLDDLCEKQSSNISANAIEENTGEYPIYGATGFLKTIDFFEIKDNYISIVKDGAGVGRLLYCEGKSSVLGTLDILKPKDVNSYFLYSLLSEIDFSKFIIGSTIPHIYFRDYKKEGFAVPSIDEQENIANLLLYVEKKIEGEKRVLEEYQNQKRYFLQSMFI